MVQKPVGHIRWVLSSHPNIFHMHEAEIELLPTCLRSSKLLLLRQKKKSRVITYMLLPGVVFVQPVHPSIFHCKSMKHWYVNLKREKNSNKVAFFLKTKLSSWDETPMMNRYWFELFDRPMHNIISYNGVDNMDKWFGGISIVLGGDFRIFFVSDKESK